AASSTRYGVAMRFLGAVLGVVVRPIAPQLAADRAAIAPEQMGDLRLRTAAHKLRRNRVSFFLGELVIRHRCNPFLARMRRQLVSPLPTSVQRVLHLPCESAESLHESLPKLRSLLAANEERVRQEHIRIP